MRKHRLYGFVLALLPLVGVILLGTSGTDNAASATRGHAARPVQLNTHSVALAADIKRLKTVRSTNADAAPAARAVMSAELSELTLFTRYRQLRGAMALDSIEIARQQQQATAALGAAIQFAAAQAEAVQQAAALAAAAKASAAQAQAQAEAAPAGGAWAEARQCESGGNYAEDSGNGYYGAYQFSLETWQAIGYPGYPNDASPATQDAAAQNLQARAGWGQWPACSATLGL